MRLVTTCVIADVISYKWWFPCIICEQYAWVSLTAFLWPRWRTESMGVGSKEMRERLNKGRQRGKGIHRMAGLRGHCCKVLMSREIWGNLSDAFRARPRAVAGDRHKEQCWRRVDKSQQAWPKCNTEQARRKQYVLFRSSVRLSISTSFLAGWDRAPHSTGYSEVAGEK